MPGEQPILLERELESEVVQQALKESRCGNGGVLMVQGTAGVGKTSVLRMVRAHALESGATVLHAQAGEFESDFPFAVTRQLLERWLMDASESERRNAFAKAAKLAEPVFEYLPGRSLPSDALQDLHSTLHGLYWTCVNLSTCRPLVITIDDVQWADMYSLRLVSYLAGRLEEKSVLLVLANRVDISGPADDILATISSAPATQVVRPFPLSRKAAHTLVNAVWQGKPSPGIADVCHEMTGGNPLLLRELLDEARRSGLEPTESNVDRLRRLVPERISQCLRTRLRRLPEPAVNLAWSVAVFGAPVNLRQCASLVDLDEASAQAAAQALVGAGILKASLLLDFTSPMIRTVVYESMPSQVRAEAHARAARELVGADASARSVADQLVRTPPGSDPWTFEVLREAAGQALAGGVPWAAVGYLRRALAECPRSELRAGVLADLGAAELRAHQPEAVGHLTEALAAAATPRDRGTVGLDLAAALVAGAQADRAADLARTLSLQLAVAEPGLAARLAVQSLSVRPGAPADARLARLAGATTGESAAARTHTLLERLRHGGCAAELIDTAEAVSGHGLLADADCEVHPGCPAGWLLAGCDRMQEAERLLARTARQADARGFVLARRTALALRAVVLAESGRLADAKAEAVNLLQAVPPRSIWGTVEPVAFGALLTVLVERDELDAAARALAAAGLDGEVPDSASFSTVLLARGRVRIARREIGDGLADILDYRRREPGTKVPAFPALAPHATAALVWLGRLDEARSLAYEELQAARAFGAARPLAAALRAAALVTDGCRGLQLLAEAVDLVETSPSLLERAHAMIDYGAALRREGHRTDSRRMLRRGVELADRCGALALRKRGYSELVVAGGRVRRKERSGDMRSLTPAERRVAEMAASGMRNQDIARELFVTVKTIEWHLSQVYPKLGIRNRVELRNALNEH